MPTAPLKLPPHHEPMYGWSLDKDNNPVPIGAAQRGVTYYCPVCKGEMVAKQGEIKQHHFAHISLVQCTPENVALAVAVRWLSKEFQQKLAEKQPVMVSWTTRDGKEKHTINILKDVASVAEHHKLEEDEIDLALLDQEGKVRVAILTGMKGAPNKDMLTRLTAGSVLAVVLDATGIRSGQIGLQKLLEQSQVHGGWWTLDEETLPDNFVSDPKTIRSMLRIVANKPPHRFYAELKDEGTFSHILELEGSRLWVPPEIWQAVVGGTRNALGKDVTVITQEWVQDDRSSIALFYIIARDTCAVAIRRFPPGQTVRYDLGTAAFRLSKTTAQELAESLAGGAIVYPQ